MSKLKVILILVLVLCVFTFSACNYQVFDFNYTFSYAYIKVGEQWIIVELSSWTDYDGEQIQLTLKDGTVMLTCSVNCILYSGNLPKE